MICQLWYSPFFAFFPLSRYYNISVALSMGLCVSQILFICISKVVSHGFYKDGADINTFKYIILNCHRFL